MAVSGSNITVSNIYSEANGSSATDIVFNDVASYSYFDGPNGDNTVSYNGWGLGTAGGQNRIYQTSFLSTDIPMSDFANLVYFYDQSTYQITLNVNNNLPAATPPTPTNDIGVDIYLKSFNGTYQYLMGNSGTINENGGTSGPIDVSTSSTPIFANAFWFIDINLLGVVGGNATITINGNVAANSVAVSPGPNSLDWNTYGSGSAGSTGGFVGLAFDVTVS